VKNLHDLYCRNITSLFFSVSVWVWGMKHLSFCCAFFSLHNVVTMLFRPEDYIAEKENVEKEKEES